MVTYAEAAVRKPIKAVLKYTMVNLGVVTVAEEERCVVREAARRAKNDVLVCDPRGARSRSLQTTRSQLGRRKKKKRALFYLGGVLSQACDGCFLVSCLYLACILLSRSYKLAVLAALMVPMMLVLVSKEEEQARARSEHRRVDVSMLSYFLPPGLTVKRQHETRSVTLTRSTIFYVRSEVDRSVGRSVGRSVDGC